MRRGPLKAGHYVRNGPLTTVQQKPDTMDPDIRADSCYPYVICDALVRGPRSMSLVALSELLGATVRDATGTGRGRVREIAVAPQDHPTRIAYLIVKTPGGERVLPPNDVKSYGSTVRTATESAQWGAPVPSDGVLLLKRDLLDQQIIDVHGRKAVRVNDVELESTPANGHVLLSVVAVDVGPRGAIRRLSKGVVPSFTLRLLLEKIPPRVIPWQFVDPLEPDPAPRVKRTIPYEG